MIYDERYDISKDRERLKAAIREMSGCQARTALEILIDSTVSTHAGNLHNPFAYQSMRNFHKILGYIDTGEPVE